MSLVGLPNELVTEIIKDAMPEDFESLALTCKMLYASCSPLIGHHNRLRKEFQHVGRCGGPPYCSDEYLTSYDVIARIAVEPIAARYIRRVSDLDRKYAIIRNRHIPTQIAKITFDEDEAVAKLLTDSSYLKQAGLDWREYYAKIREDVSAHQYSQYAAAFLLTLLPNTNDLMLPHLWKPLEATEKLLEIVVRRAQQSSLSHDNSSLAKVTKFSLYVSSLHFASPFFGLPHMSSFIGGDLVRSADSYHYMIPEAPNRRFGASVENINLWSCHLDETEIAELLNRTPRLKRLEYSHTWYFSRKCRWDICKFVAAIEQKVASHLVELSLITEEFPRVSIVPRTTSLRGFHHLRKLKLPIEVIRNNIIASDERLLTALDEVPAQGSECSKVDSEHDFSSIANILPASLTHLWLVSHEYSHDFYLKTLNTTFEDFRALKAAQLPNLEEICFSFQQDVDNGPLKRGREQKEQVEVIRRFTRWCSTFGVIWNDLEQKGYIFRDGLPPDPSNSN